uniref:BHLH domain-containing protein n=1 Tax=Acrobeloides nanus TaxID=290746 RepID=A0A914C5Q2_9BILA
MNPSERKKQTHLRCERQRREAINSGYNSLKELLPASSSFSGYNSLKELLPASSSFVGCKTTNAAILFRAAEYVKVLNDSIAKSEEDLSKLRTQYSALELIMQQYENFSMESQPFTALQIQMLQGFLDACFESFVNHVDASSYQAITRSLLMWIEQLDFQRPAEELVAPVYRQTR